VLGAYGAASDADAGGCAAPRDGAAADRVPVDDAARTAPPLWAMVVRHSRQGLRGAEFAAVDLGLVLRPLCVLAHPRPLWLGVAARAGACVRASVLLRQRLRLLVGGHRALRPTAARLR